MSDEPTPTDHESFSGKCPTCGQPYLEAEIRRLRDVVRELEAASDAWQARVMQLEANAAITFGTLEQPTPDEPTTIVHDVPPNAPPHDE